MSDFIVYQINQKIPTRLYTFAKMSLLQNFNLKFNFMVLGSLGLSDIIFCWKNETVCQYEKTTNKKLPGY